MRDMHRNTGKTAENGFIAELYTRIRNPLLYPPELRVQPQATIAVAETTASEKWGGRSAGRSALKTILRTDSLLPLLAGRLSPTAARLHFENHREAPWAQEDRRGNWPAPVGGEGSI